MQHVIKQLKSLSDTQITDFITGILTPHELDQLNKRVEIIKLLKQGKTQREIAHQLNVGIATVTRGSRELAKGRFKYV